MSRLADELNRAAERDKLRLHTPGHKGTLCSLDLTELTDDSFPGDCVKTAEARAAKVYGAKHARYLCGGSSQGVKSAVYYSGVSAVVDINSHRSVFDGFRLSGKTAITVGERGGVRPITVEQIDSAVTCDVGAVVVTTPTYYGYCADVDGIADYCKRKGLLFIVDSAHGAHFGFSPRLPESAVPHCDICNVSTHKTLTALTQSAVLFDNLGGAQSAELSECVDIMGSTSPSYLLYASIDGAVEKIAAAKTRAAYEAIFAPIEQLRHDLPFLKNDDFTRLVLDCAALGLSPQKLNGALARRGVYSELVDSEHIVFIFTAENSPADAELLGKTLEDCIREIK